MWTEIVLKIVYIGAGILVLWTVLFFVSPSKMTKFMARIALLFRSVEETRTHKRMEDDSPHVHKRVSISDFAQTTTQDKPEVSALVKKISEQRKSK